LYFNYRIDERTASTKRTTKEKTHPGSAAAAPINAANAARRVCDADLLIGDARRQRSGSAAFNSTFQRGTACARVVQLEGDHTPVVLPARLVVGRARDRKL